MLNRFNPRNWLQRHHQRLQTQLDQHLASPSLGLPTPDRWTRHLTQTLLVGVVAGAGWATMARVDVVVNASGSLEPQSQTQVVQSRAGGIVTAISVQEGQTVKRGQLILQLDKTALQNQWRNLLVQRQQLVQEIAVLRMAQQGDDAALDAVDIRGMSPELQADVQRRRLLIAQLSGNPRGLDALQRQRYDLYQQQLRDRQSLSALQVTNIATQIEQTDAQADQTAFQLETEQALVTNLQSLAAEGAIPRVTVLQRQVGLGELRSQLTKASLQKRQLEIGQLQTQVEAEKSFTDTQQDLQQQLAALDNQFATTVKESQRRLVEVNAKLKQVQLDLKQQDLRAPTDGVVFNLGPKLPGIVSQPGQTLLQVVPKESLLARVQVANADIANIRPGMAVDVRMEAYPFTEFGAIRGVVTQVGREALKTEQQGGMFPVEIRLERQFLERQDRRFTLTPGMRVVTLIKVRQRAPISYITEEITKAFDGFKSVQ
jgi:hemolysin D